MDLSDSEEESRKRKPVDVEIYQPSASTLLAEELSLEIGLRTRLKELVESRLTWACLLQDSLTRHYETVLVEDASTSVFAEAACDAYRAIHDSSRFLLDESQSKKPIIPERIAVPELQEPPRPRIRQHPNYYSNIDRRDSHKFLYIRDTQSTPALLYKLACPDCGRSDFPKLQGMLNHCRLKHKREFGSHDECIQRCAQPITSEEEQGEIIEFGTEITLMSAGLRRLFEMAVGTESGLIVQQNPMEFYDDSKPVESDEAAALSTLQTRSLGLHKDSPALAPFLGKKVKAKKINVVESLDEIDIVGDEDEEAYVTHRPWKMSYQLRSSANKNDKADDSDEGIGSGSAMDAELALTAKTASTLTSSRFHIKVRLIIADWSLRLSDDNPMKQGGDFTHKWMLSIHSPTYSTHASMVVKSVTVSSSSSSVSALPAPVTVSDPPFAVTGFSDKPFLAHITIDWAGSSNKEVELEHWVELEDRVTSKPVLGDEQYLDVELDRSTILLPRREDVWSVDWGTKTTELRTEMKNKEESRPTEARSTTNNPHLNALVRQFPLARKDISSRTVPRLPYYLPQSTSDFLQMNIGRRKAIEFARARALWQAYVGEIKKEESPSDDGAKFSGPFDVLRWMHAEGHFPAPISASSAPTTQPQKEVDGTQNLSSAITVRKEEELYCGTCGLSASAHSRGKRADSLIFCKPTSEVLKPPFLNARSLCYERSPNIGPTVETFYEVEKNLDLRLLLNASDPRIIQSIRRSLEKLQLSCLQPHDLARLSTVARTTAENELAPFALFGVLTKVFISRLIAEGLRYAVRQPVPQKRVNGSTQDAKRKQILTPAHILRGLAFLGRLGVLADSDEDQ